MICTKCGQENPDEALACQACAHKLQSGRPGWGESCDLPSFSPLPPLKGPGPAARRKARSHLEAWGVAVLFACASYGLILLGLAWAVWPLAGVAAAYAWARGIGWRD